MFQKYASSSFSIINLYIPYSTIAGVLLAVHVYIQLLFINEGLRICAVEDNFG